MRQRSDGAGFKLESGDDVGLFRELLGNEFDGNTPAQTSVPGAVNLTHTTDPEDSFNFVRPKPCPVVDRHPAAFYF